MQTDYPTIQNLFLLLMMVLFYFFFRRTHLKLKKRQEANELAMKLIDESKNAKDFEIAYIELKKADYGILYLTWCVKFTKQLEEIQNSLLKDKDKLEDKPFEDLLNKTHKLFEFFASACNYLNPAEQNILNAITNQKLGISIISDCDLFD